ncbi:MAG: transcriptional repressor [Dysosmobacter welbionis]
MPQRFPQQRERIYQTVLESRAHPTAEMVYQQLKPEMPRLSLGTVYRNLQQMAREGRLTELDGPVTRFDAVTRPHTHFRCRAAGCAGSGDCAL